MGKNCQYWQVYKLYLTGGSAFENPLNRQSSAAGEVPSAQQVAGDCAAVFRATVPPWGMLIRDMFKVTTAGSGRFVHCAQPKET